MQNENPSQDTPAAAPVSPIKRVDLIVAIVLALVVLTAGGSMLVSHCGFALDDGVYISTAKSLASGHGYRLINLPGAPFQKKYPILYPFLLSIIWRADPNFDSNVLVMNWLSAVSGALGVSIGYLYLVRWGYTNRVCAAAGAAICSLCVGYLSYATMPMSEGPFTVFNLCAMWLLESYLRRSAPPRRLEQIFTGMVLGLPFLCRLAGGTLLPVALGLIARSRRPLLLVMLGMCLTVGPWVIWAATGYDPQSKEMIRGQNQDYVIEWKRFCKLAPIYIPRNFTSAISDTGLILVQDGNKPNQFNLSIGLLTICLAAITWILLGKDLLKFSTLSTVLFAYLMVMSLWPWPVTRYLVPLFPLLSGLFVTTVAKLLSWLKQEQVRTIAILALTAGALYMNSMDAARKTKMDRAHDQPTPPHYYALTTTSWSNYESLFHWVKEHTPADCVLSAELDSMVYLYTDRTCFRPILPNNGSLYFQVNEPPFLGSLTDFRQTLIRHHAAYLVCTPNPSAAEEKPFDQLVDQFKKTYPEEFIPVYVGDDKRFVVYKFAPTAEK
ncbi:MAG TPA: hypothetical protein V6C69_09300 [Trichormus sp.]|jgi:hypothetical protein